MPAAALNHATRKMCVYYTPSWQGGPLRAPVASPRPCGASRHRAGSAPAERLAVPSPLMGASKLPQDPHGRGDFALPWTPSTNGLSCPLEPTTRRAPTGPAPRTSAVVPGPPGCRFALRRGCRSSRHPTPARGKALAAYYGEKSGIHPSVSLTYNAVSSSYVLDLPLFSSLSCLDRHRPEGKGKNAIRPSAGYFKEA